MEKVLLEFQRGSTHLGSKLRSVPRVGFFARPVAPIELRAWLPEDKYETIMDSLDKLIEQKAQEYVEFLHKAKMAQRSCFIPIPGVAAIGMGSMVSAINKAEKKVMEIVEMAKSWCLEVSKDFAVHGVQFRIEQSTRTVATNKRSVQVKHFDLVIVVVDAARAGSELPIASAPKTETPAAADSNINSWPPSKPAPKPLPVIPLYPTPAPRPNRVVSPRGTTTWVNAAKNGPRSPSTRVASFQTQRADAESSDEGTRVPTQIDFGMQRSLARQAQSSESLGELDQLLTACGLMRYKEVLTVDFKIETPEDLRGVSMRQLEDILPKSKAKKIMLTYLATY